MKTKFPFSFCALLLLLILQHPLQAQYWQLTGNSGTVPPTNFIGTTDNKALLFKTQSKSGCALAREAMCVSGLINLR